MTDCAVMFPAHLKEVVRTRGLLRDDMGIAESLWRALYRHGYTFDQETVRAAINAEDYAPNTKVLGALIDVLELSPAESEEFTIRFYFYQH